MPNADASSTTGAPLRVLHIVSGDLWAGAEVQVHELLRAAVSVPDLEIRAAVLNPGILAERLVAAGIDVTVLDESVLSFPSLARRIMALARDWRPAVIHTHRRKEHLLGVMAAASCDAGLVGTIHGRGESEHSWLNLRQNAARAAERFVLSHIHDKLIAVSEDLATELPGPAAHKVVIANSIDVEAVRRAASAVPPGPEPAARIRIGFLGRLVPVKQVDRILQMMALLEEERPGGYALHIVGDGPLHDELQQLARGLDLGDAVNFHGFLENPLPLLASMDALMFASAHEGLPMTALESLALGVPIVGPPIGSISRLVTESGAGIVAASSAARDLADALLQCPLHRIEEQEIGPCLLPARYRVENGLLETLRLWRDVSCRSDV
jgi:L-malate glycosyltransferase